MIGISSSILTWCKPLAVAILLMTPPTSTLLAATYEIFPSANPACDEEFVRVANGLQPGDELVLHGGLYSQNCRRGISVNGTPSKPIVIRAAAGAHPLLTRPRENTDTHNNIEFVNSSYLVVKGLRFKGGSIGVRFIGGHHVTLEDCEIFETGNVGLAMHSRDIDAFIVRRNHIHHTGLSESGPTEGEGMYIGCHDSSCRTTNSVIEGNYIHHLRATSGGGNDGIEVKPGSYGNIIRHNVIHDTNIGRHFPCIFVYGGGAGVNIVEGNAVWNCGEGIQVISDAIVRNNIVFNSSITGITAAPHAMVPYVRNTTIINNTIVGHPTCVYMRWDSAENSIFANNAIYCPSGKALDVSGLDEPTVMVRANYVEGQLIGASLDRRRFFFGASINSTFANPDQFDFWPRRESQLSGKADEKITSKTDFNGRARSAPYDVGAYETDGSTINTGWKIAPGFKELMN